MSLYSFFSNQIVTYILFILIITGNYFFMRKIASISNLDYSSKNTKQDYEDLIKIIMGSTIFWYVSHGLFNIEQQSVYKKRQNIYRVVFLFFALIFSNIYGFIEKVTGLDISLNRYNSLQFLLYGGLPILLIILTYIIMMYIYFVKSNDNEVYEINGDLDIYINEEINNQNDITRVCGTLLVIILSSIVLYTTAYTLVDSNIKLHAHHWAIFFMLSLLLSTLSSIIKTKTRMQYILKIFGIIFAGITFGIFLHGAVYYSMDEFTLDDSTWQHNEYIIRCIKVVNFLNNHVNGLNMPLSNCLL